MAARKSKPRNSRVPRIYEYGAYRFKGQDPLIGEVLETVRSQIEAIEGNGGAKRSTLRVWDKRGNRYSHSDTLQATLRAAGYRLKIVRATD
jgi:hypothetical protein